MDANSPKITKGTRKGCSYNGRGASFTGALRYLSLYSFDSFLRDYCDLAVVHCQECHLTADQFVG